MIKRTEKYPVLTYLFCILAVSVLLTGVTFARYKTAVSSDLGTNIASFGCSYSVDDISTTSIPNVDYWLSGGEETGAASTPRTMRFTLRNYTSDKTSVVDTYGNLRVYMPAEIADKIAFQLAEMSDDGSIAYYSPEIVLGELVYDGGNYRTYNSERLNTSTFTDYYDSAASKNGQEEWLFVDGSLAASAVNAEGERKLTAQGEEGGSGIKMTVTAKSITTDYSVGFHRGKTEEDYSSQLFLELEKDIDFYTVDFSLPSMSFKAADGRRSASYVLYMTLTDRITASEMSVNWSDEGNADKFNGFLTNPPTSEEEAATDAYSFNGARVTGYHFEQTPQYADGSGTTNVRVSCVYDYNGAFSVSLQHIAPLSDSESANYAHPIIFNGVQSVTYNPADADFSFGSSTGVCVNESGGKQIDISSLYVTPLSRIESDGSVTNFGIYEALAKSYRVRYSAVFVQASEEGGK